MGGGRLAAAPEDTDLLPAKLAARRHVVAVDRDPISALAVIAVFRKWNECQGSLKCKSGAATRHSPAETVTEGIPNRELEFGVIHAVLIFVAPEEKKQPSETMHAAGSGQHPSSELACYLPPFCSTTSCASWGTIERCTNRCWAYKHMAEGAGTSVGSETEAIVSAPVVQRTDEKFQKAPGHSPRTGSPPHWGILPDPRHQ